MEQKIEAAESKMIEALQYEGEQFINKARSTGTYTDRTGNLRSSIGYVILKDGKTIQSVFPGSKSKGNQEARKTVREVKGNYPNGFVLIGVAGMNYAAAVESKGYDVITGSSPTDNAIKDLFGAIKL